MWPKNRLSKWILFSCAGLICLLVASEVLLRTVWGFCDAVLYRSDKDFEYIEIPQKRVRFGKLNYYNAFSQRNGEVTAQDSVIIDGFGDSVINGGAMVDQDSLATTKLSKYLSERDHTPVKVLNIAAGSWGPDNCFAYLKKYGNFGCKKIFLVVSSHDAFDDMTFEKTVGVDPEHPDRQYHLALWELLDRYVIPRLRHKAASEQLFINKRQDNTPFNSGFGDFFHYCADRKIPLLIYLHAEKGELAQGKYDDEGQMIIDTCRKYQIPLVKDLDYHLSPEVYRDKIHFNNRGQQAMFAILRDSL